MRSILTRVVASAVGVAVVAATGLTAPASAVSAGPSTKLIHGHVAGAAPNGATFAGRFTPSHFEQRPGRIVAVGNLHGRLTRADGRTAVVDRGLRMRVTRLDFIGQRTATAMAFRASARRAVGSCQILNLVLGPLDLNLLGLKVHLNRVHLNITAATGPGNLLGNLLCAVAHLLDGVGLGGLLARVTGVLNRILTSLNAANV